MGIKNSLICKDAPKGSISRRIPRLKKLEEFCGKRRIIPLEKGIEKYLEEIENWNRWLRSCWKGNIKRV